MSELSTLSSWLFFSFCPVLILWLSSVLFFHLSQPGILSLWTAIKVRRPWSQACYYAFASRIHLVFPQHQHRLQRFGLRSSFCKTLEASVSTAWQKGELADWCEQFGCLFLSCGLSEPAFLEQLRCLNPGQCSAVWNKALCTTKSDDALWLRRRARCLPPS